MRKIKNSKLFKFLHSVYLKLFQINDSPQKIALGLGLGVFSGIIPGTGPIAALFLALLFKANKASALLGCLLTNTWLSVLILILAIKAGSGILNINWQQVYQNWSSFLADFHWLILLKFSVLQLIFPVIIGYLVVGLSLGILVYLISLIALTFERKRRGRC